MNSAPPEHTLWSDLPGAPQVGTVLCDLQALVDGGVRCIDHPVSQPPAESSGALVVKNYRMLILRSGSNVKAYLNRCAHFGVPLGETSDKLIFVPHKTLSCNVHYAKYQWDDGLCISGDCEGESLIPVPVKVNSKDQVEIGEDLT